MYSLADEYTLRKTPLVGKELSNALNSRDAARAWRGSDRAATRAFWFAPSIASTVPLPPRRLRGDGRPLRHSHLLFSHCYSLCHWSPPSPHFFFFLLERAFNVLSVGHRPRYFPEKPLARSFPCSF